jgi:hypothetical protein
MPDLEPYTLYFLGGGAACLMVGLILLLVAAFKTGFFKKALLPVLLVLLGAAIALFVPVSTKLFPKPVQTTGVTEKKTDAQGNEELRLTLTGAKREEYARLKAAKYAVVQWANSDVTDDDAAALAEQSELRELKLNDAQVTDVTLERLVKLPKLTKLYIARTRVTPDGVVKHIFNNPACKLVEIDLNVPGKAVRDWKAADKTRQVSQ